MTDKLSIKLGSLLALEANESHADKRAWFYIVTEIYEIEGQSWVRGVRLYPLTPYYESQSLGHIKEINKEINGQYEGPSDLQWRLVA
jgi:hypothetical protein